VLVGHCHNDDTQTYISVQATSTLVAMQCLAVFIEQDLQKPPQAEQGQGTDRLDRNTSAVGQGKRHRVNISVGRCPFFDDSV